MTRQSSALGACADRQRIQIEAAGCCAQHRLPAEPTRSARDEAPTSPTTVTAVNDWLSRGGGDPQRAGCLERVLAGTGATAQLVPDAQREHPEQGCPPAELIEVVAVKGSSVVRRRGRRRVQLGSPGTAATLALPSHGGALCREPEAMPEDPTRHHGIDRSRTRRVRDRKGPRHYERARTRTAPELRTATAATRRSAEVLWS